MAKFLSFTLSNIEHCTIWFVEHLDSRTFDFSKFWCFVKIRTTDGRNFGIRKFGFRKNNVAPFLSKLTNFFLKYVHTATLHIWLKKRQWSIFGYKHFRRIFEKILRKIFEKILRKIFEKILRKIRASLFCYKKVAQIDPIVIDTKQRDSKTQVSQGKTHAL
jgi:hypothetical protein